MDGIAAINARMAQIESRMASLSASPASGVLGSTALATSSATASRSTEFASALSDALGSLGVTGTTAADAVGSGKALINASGVPLEYLASYSNGEIPAAALSPISGTNHSLWAPAARSFEALRSAAAADGVQIGITDSYRTLDTQKQLVATKGLYSQGGLAAEPGTSRHGWGMAVDLSLDSNALSWMRENAGRYGFVEETPRESWHWGYHPTS